MNLDDIFKTKRSRGAEFENLEAVHLKLVTQPLRQRSLFVCNQDSGQAMAALERKSPGARGPARRDWIQKATGSETLCKYSVT